MKLQTRLRSTAMRYLSSESYQQKQRERARRRRERRDEPPVVHYFHQVDDPYSHLAVQKLDSLRQRYRLAWQAHLVTPPTDTYRGSADHFDTWARRDAQSIAADYGVSFAPERNTPDATLIERANGVLAGCLASDEFAAVATDVGQALWADGNLAREGDAHAARGALESGDQLRGSLGHYQGGMFHYDGEWYWGIDRLRLLETRLVDEGFGDGDTGLCVPEPGVSPPTGPAAESVTLEYFPSLRSPYTAIGHQRVLDAIERTNVTVKLRPVMPMLMRGLPAPRAKQRYIITDAGREGRWRGTPFGRIVDPFGEPVRRAFALYAGADALGQAMAFVTAYLNAAWFDGTDITTTAGLQRVATHAGIEWDALENAAREADWDAILDDNLDAMLAAGLWGVPSFRVTGGAIDVPFACWGQDRIWRVENEIRARS